ncbi:MAG: hypothetical protein HKN87_12645 [Saprospiraceae bacterium]|nr:hypothetical protein [Saprospiraceae bacterium]
MRLLIVSIFCLPFLQLPAQDLVGRLLDGAGHPVVGAYIFTGEGELHAHSNGSGRFELKGVVEGDTVHISSLGYEPLTYTFAEKTTHRW